MEYPPGVSERLLAIIERAHDKDPAATEADIAYMPDSEQDSPGSGTGIDWGSVLTHLKTRRP